MKYTAKHEIYYREVVLRNDNWVQVEPERITDLGFPLCNHPAILEFVTRKEVFNFDPLNPGIYPDAYRIPPVEMVYYQTLACVKRSKLKSSDVSDSNVIITKKYVDDMLEVWNEMRKKPCPRGNMAMYFVFMYADCYYEFDAKILGSLIKTKGEDITITRAFYNPRTCKKENNTVYAIPMVYGGKYDYKATTKNQRDELYAKYDTSEAPTGELIVPGESFPPFIVKPPVISPLI